jgi:hypothetical protein
MVEIFAFLAIPGFEISALAATAAALCEAFRPSHAAKVMAPRYGRPSFQKGTPWAWDARSRCSRDFTLNSIDL